MHKAVQKIYVVLLVVKQAVKNENIFVFIDN